MGEYYDELLEDVCLVCGMGLMEDLTPEIRRCTNCSVKEVSYREPSKQHEQWMQ